MSEKGKRGGIGVFPSASHTPSDPHALAFMQTVSKISDHFHKKVVYHQSDV